MHRRNPLTLHYIFSTDPPAGRYQDTSFRLRMRMNVYYLINGAMRQDRVFVV